MQMDCGFIKLSGGKNPALKLSVVHVGLYKRLIKTFCCTLMDQLV